MVVAVRWRLGSAEEMGMDKKSLGSAQEVENMRRSGRD